MQRGSLDMTGSEQIAEDFPGKTRTMLYDPKVTWSVLQGLFAFRVQLDDGSQVTILMNPVTTQALKRYLLANFDKKETA